MRLTSLRMGHPVLSTNRKGIYQTFAPSGDVIADERWQAIRMPDASIRVDNETVRVAPFDEPRSDAMTIVLDPQLRLIEFTIHGLFGKRESRICVSGEHRDQATICWRHQAEIHEKRIAWREDIEIGWTTPLCVMVTVWRSRLQPGQSRAFDAFLLDAITFKPTAVRQIYRRRPDESHSTRFGEMMLQHYEIATQA
ncbi:MAG: putative glycolipid-binding domain-containing protein, partial [Anaerolineae bacterium]|nr:putative glycolipid-binding domain-containing protein [Anaerolineae bacterium]